MTGTGRRVVVGAGNSKRMTGFGYEYPSVGFGGCEID